jgi:hypothetical protein
MVTWQSAKFNELQGSCRQRDVLAAKLRAMVQGHRQLAHEDCFTGGRFGGFSLIFLSAAPQRLD